MQPYVYNNFESAVLVLFNTIAFRPKENVLKALWFADKMHTGQKRKYTNEDYIIHPVFVANLVAKYLISIEEYEEDMICAALLHDVVEDCGVSLDDIRSLFGDNVTNLVHWLTSPSKWFYGSRAIKKHIDSHFFMIAPVEAVIIKLCDIIDNTKSIEFFDSAFATRYYAEKKSFINNIGIFSGIVPVIAPSQANHIILLELADKLKDTVFGIIDKDGSTNTK